jgi:hypothetical protein
MLLAAQLSLPMAVGLTAPGHPVFSSSDMPAYFAARNLTRFVRTRTTVAADGTAQNCVAERSGGDAYLDARTCAIIMQRAKFAPARWIDGSPVYGVLRVDVVWGYLPPGFDLRPDFPADMDVFVNRLPRGARKAATVDVMIAVDDAGRVRGCGEATSPLRHGKTFPELVPIACQQLTEQFTAVPAKDATGKPVRSVQSASVDFKTGK